MYDTVEAAQFKDLVDLFPRVQRCVEDCGSRRSDAVIRGRHCRVLSGVFAADFTPGTNLCAIIFPQAGIMTTVTGTEVSDRATIMSELDTILVATDHAVLDRLIGAVGMHAITLLADRIDYPRRDEIFDLAMKRSIARHAENGDDDMAYDYVYGCRDPTSDCTFLVAKESETKFITSALIANGVDYISHPVSDEEAMAQYDWYDAKGWVKMTRCELARGSGIKNIPMVPLSCGGGRLAP